MTRYRGILDKSKYLSYKKSDQSPKGINFMTGHEWLRKVMDIEARPKKKKDNMFLCIL